MTREEQIGLCTLEKAGFMAPSASPSSVIPAPPRVLVKVLYRSVRSTVFRTQRYQATNVNAPCARLGGIRPIPLRAPRSCGTSGRRRMYLPFKDIDNYGGMPPSSTQCVAVGIKTCCKPPAFWGSSDRTNGKRRFPAALQLLGFSAPAPQKLNQTRPVPVPDTVHQGQCQSLGRALLRFRGGSKQAHF